MADSAAGGVCSTGTSSAQLCVFPGPAVVAASPVSVSAGSRATSTPPSGLDSDVANLASQLDSAVAFAAEVSTVAAAGTICVSVGWEDSSGTGSRSASISVNPA